MLPKEVVLLRVSISAGVYGMGLSPIRNASIGKLVSCTSLALEKAPSVKRNGLTGNRRLVVR